ncbi:hypothetical protein B0J12DRAFT_6973 [Macrophomina phaseolina]|uniref:Uncharacterized protein n=1 Tax=Macrophomina phaseolina TaxID=35725 RepID=A0ABQ8GTS5_9PEZI|nr:hypothetical protein B0J12DRAFT_6973 [Macrophomina phaseolina]
MWWPALVAPGEHCAYTGLPLTRPTSTDSILPPVAARGRDCACPPRCRRDARRCTARAMAPLVRYVVSLAPLGRFGFISTRADDKSLANLYTPPPSTRAQQTAVTQHARSVAGLLASMHGAESRRTPTRSPSPAAPAHASAAISSYISRHAPADNWPSSARPPSPLHGTVRRHLTTVSLEGAVSPGVETREKAIFTPSTQITACPFPDSSALKRVISRSVMAPSPTMPRGPFSRRAAARSTLVMPSLPEADKQGVVSKHPSCCSGTHA